MAHTVLNYRNPVNNETRKVPVGFSWTTLFFGIFPALFRGDWKWAIIMALIALPTYGMSFFIFPFFYNRLYRNDVESKGFEVEGQTVPGITRVAEQAV